MIKVVMFSKFPENVQEYFKKELADWAELIIPADRSEDNLCKVVKDADVLLGWKSSRKILSAATKAKLFINPGAGVERHTQLFREFHAITLVNTHGNSSAVAQHAIAMLLTLTNQIIPHHHWMKEGNWLFGDDTVKSTLLQNKTVGLLGFGAIAKQFARFVSGFDLNMIVYKRRQIDE
ncbi:MAG: hypothetical protein MI862_00910, partial [Desulfobacterales bacterium]|nr:hypothetical protein [Desulfobacterales bacterium]